MFGLPVVSTRYQSPRACPSWTRAAGLVGAAMLFAITMFAIMGNAQEKPAAPPSPPPDNKPAEFVGSTTCQMCHEDRSEEHTSELQSLRHVECRLLLCN